MHNCQKFIINDLCFSCVFLQIHLFDIFMICIVLTEVLTQLKGQFLTIFVQRI